MNKKRPDNNTVIRHSLSSRLSLWIVLFAAAMFLLSLGYIFVVAQKAVRRMHGKGIPAGL